MKKKDKMLNTSVEELEESQLNNSNFDNIALRKRLEEENKFLTMLVNTIPPKIYFDQDMQELITAEKHLNMNKAVEDLKIKTSSNLKLSSKNKHKRARLNPLFQKSVSEIHQELNEKKIKKTKKDLENQPASFIRAANIEELQKRLQDRITELRAKRNATETDLLEKKRLQRKVKNMKNKKKKGNTMKAISIVKDPDNILKKKKKSVKKATPQQVYNKDGHVIFSKFDFSESGDGQMDRPKQKGVAKKGKALLLKAEKEKEKIEDLKKTDADKAKIIIQKAAWKRAIQKSEGIKLKDDPVLLKKSIKRREKLKQKNTKKWKERQEHLESKIQARQAKRTKNIKSRNKEKFDSKIKQAKKKGRVIPGF